MKENWILILSIFISFSLKGQQSFTIEEAILYGMESNNSLKYKDLDLADAIAQVNEYKSIGLPNVKFNAKYDYFPAVPAVPIDDFVSPGIYSILFSENVIPTKEIGPFEANKFSFNTKNNLSASVDVNWLLFDGSYLSGIKAARLYKDLVAKEKEVTKEETAANITKAYLGVLIASENKRFLEQNIVVVKSYKTQLEEIYKNGFIEQLDVDRIALTLTNLETSLIQINHMIEINKNILKYQMAYPIEQHIKLADNLEELADVVLAEKIDLDSPIEYNDRASFANIETSKALNELNIQRINREKLPSIRAYASASESLQRNNIFDGTESGLIPSVLIGLGLSVPIYSGGKIDATAQRAKIDLDRLNLQEKEFKRSIFLQTQNARLQIQNAKQGVVRAKTLLTLSERVLSKTQIKFSEGVGSSLEVTQAQTELYNSQNKYIESIYQLVLAKTELEIALGTIE